MRNPRYIKAIIATVLFAAFVMYYLVLPEAQSRPAKWSRGTQMDAVQVLRDSSIDTLLIDPDDWAIIAKIRGGKLQAGVIDSTTLTTAFKTLLKHGFIMYAETSNVSLTAAGSTDSSRVTGQFPYRFYVKGGSSGTGSWPLFDSQTWGVVFDTVNGLGSARIVVRDRDGDQSYFMDSSATRALITSLAVTPSDTVDYARACSIATYALNILSVDTTTLVDEAVKSQYTDSLAASSVDVLDSVAFTTDFKNYFMTSRAQNQALDASESPGSSNRYMTYSDVDTTSVSSITAIQTPSMGFGRTTIPNYGVVIDTNSSHPAIRPRSGAAYFAFIDSNAVAKLVTDSLQAAYDSIDATITYAEDYADNVVSQLGDSVIRRGAGLTPIRFSISNNAPTSPRIGDVYIDTTGSAASDSATMYVVAADSAWSVVGGGGGGGAGSVDEVVTDRYSTMDVDSFIVRSRDDTMYADLLIKDNITVEDTARFVHGISTKLRVDTLGNNGASSLYITATILPRDSATYDIGAELKPIESVYANHFYSPSTDDGIAIYTTDDIQTAGDFRATGGYVYSDDIRPYAGANDTQDTLGYSSSTGNTTLSYNSYLRSLMVGSSSAAYFSVPSTGTVTLKGRTLYLDNSQLTINNNNFEFSGGAGVRTATFIDGDVVISRTGSFEPELKLMNGVDMSIYPDRHISWGSGYLTISADYPSEAPLVTNGAGEKDTLDFLTEDQNKSIDATCPAPSATNPLVTAEALRMNNVMLGVPEVMEKASWIYSNRKEFWDGWIALHGTSCQPSDSMAWPDDIDQSQLIENTRLHIPIYPQDTLVIEHPTDPPPDYNPAMLDHYEEPITFGLASVGVPSDSEFVMYVESIGNTPSIIGESRVNTRYNDSLGTITGCFNTATAAADSIPNCYVYCDSFKTDTVWLNLSADNLFRYGTVTADTINTIPSVFNAIGAWFCAATSTPDSASSWWPIDHWVNDSVIVLTKSLWASVESTSEAGVIARKHLITFEKPQNGSIVLVSDTIKINPTVSPVHIRGEGEDVTVVTNVVNGYKRKSTEPHIFWAAPSTYGFGCPIEISGITVISTWDSASTKAPISLNGRVKLKDMRIAGTTGPASPLVEILDLVTDVSACNGMTSLELDNVKMVSDSDRYCIEIGDTLVAFNANRCAFSYGGSSGFVLKTTQDGGADRRQFYDCMFFEPTDANLTVAYPFDVTASDTVMAARCTFLGLSTFKETNDRIIGTAGTIFNYEDAAVVVPPAILNRSSWPLITPQMK